MRWPGDALIAQTLAPSNCPADERAPYPEALHLACSHDHPVVDAVYVVTARRHGARLVTYDRRLHALCGLAGVDGELFGV